MLMKSGGAGGGRDVLFRLMVATDPQAKQALKEWGDMLAKTQTAADKAAVEGQKKLAEERKRQTQSTAKDQDRESARATAAQLKQDRIIAQNYLKEHLRALDDRTRAEKRAEDDLAKWRDKVRQNSARLEQQDNLRSLQEKKRAASELEQWRLRVRQNSAVLEQKENIRLVREGEREAMRQRNMAQLASARRGAAATQFVEGAGSLARGVAYSGLIGERNTQTVLNTILGVEATGSIARGGINTARGLSGMTGMAMGAGGAVGGGTAAVAALLAWLPALASAVKGAAVAIKGSESTRRGDISGGFGEGIAGTYAGAMGKLPPWMRNAASNQFSFAQSALIGPLGTSLLSGTVLGGGGLDPYDKLAGSSANFERMQGSAEARRQAIASQAGMVGDLGQMQRESSRGNLGASQAMLKGDVSRFNEMSAGGQSNAAVQAAYQNVRESMEQVRSISLDVANTQLEGSRAQLANLHQSASLAKQIADETKRAYQSDIMKAATADPEERVRIQTIARKRAAGETLSRTEIGHAAQYNEFRDYASSEAEKRAEEAGLSGYFEGGRKKAEEALKKSEGITADIAKSELEVKQKTEVVVRLEGGDWASEILKGIDESLPAKLGELETRVQQRMEERIKQAQAQFANARAATR